VIDVVDCHSPPHSSGLCTGHVCWASGWCIMRAFRLLQHLCKLYQLVRPGCFFSRSSGCCSSSICWSFIWLSFFFHLLVVMVPAHTTTCGSACDVVGSYDLVSAHRTSVLAVCTLRHYGLEEHRQRVRLQVSVLLHSVVVCLPVLVAFCKHALFHCFAGLLWFLFSDWPFRVEVMKGVQNTVVFQVRTPERECSLFPLLFFSFLLDFALFLNTDPITSTHTHTHTHRTCSALHRKWLRPTVNSSSLQWSRCFSSSCYVCFPLC
jgi:hypothetical protein